MRQTSLFSGIIYIFLGILFTYFAIQNVEQDGWGLFSYLLVLLATFDLGNGLRVILFHFKNKNESSR